MGLATARASLADEGGVSFWLPGTFGSFAATPSESGWSWTTLYYHGAANASAGQAFTRGGKARVDLGLSGTGDLFLFGPAYTFEEPIAGAQLSISLLSFGGRNQAGVDTRLTGPNGGAIAGSRSDALTAFGDLLPQVTMKWSAGVNNYMGYVTGDIPIGSYDPNRLANLGIGHGAIDVGGGYTYLQPATGREFSAALGFTYNFENRSTNYQNGIDGHLELGASQFLNEQLFVGVAAYYYQQVSGDSGAGAVLGSFKSRVVGAGPQVGYLFPLGEKLQAALSAKAYGEFAAQNRPDGWNVWFGISISAAPPKAR